MTDSSLSKMNSATRPKNLESKEIFPKYLENFSISNHLIMKEAEHRGWLTKIIDMNKNRIALFPVKNDPCQMIVLQRTTSELNTAIGFIIANDKLLTQTIANHFQVPMPESIAYMPKRDGFLEELSKFLERHRQLVVKPTDCSSGDGITTKITNLQQLQKALEYAKSFSSNIMIQAYVPGNDYRILVLNGRVIAASWRRPAFVVGNGRQTVRELVELKNVHPFRGLQQNKPLKSIDLHEVTEYIGVDRLESVPICGEEIQVIGVASISRGGESEDVTELLHPSICHLAEKITNACQLGLCGVDMLIDGDITKPIGAECKATLIEVNATPGLRMHHFPVSGGYPRNVSAAILDEIQRRRENVVTGVRFPPVVPDRNDLDRETFFAQILSNPEEFLPLSNGELEYNCGN